MFTISSPACEIEYGGDHKNPQDLEPDHQPLSNRKPKPCLCFELIGQPPSILLQIAYETSYPAGQELHDDNYIYQGDGIPGEHQEHDIALMSKFRFTTAKDVTNDNG